MKIRVMYLTHTAKLGGAEKSLYNLIKNIDTSMYEPILVCGENGELVESIKKLGVRAEVIPMKQINTKYKIKGLYRLATTSIKLRNFIKANKIDVVHNNTYRARFFGTIAGFMSNIKIITHVRDIMHWTFIEKELTKFEDRIIAISNAVNNHIFDQIDSNERIKVSRIYNGVDIDEFNPNTLEKSILRDEYSIDEDKIILGAVGRFDEWKRFDLFVEAANILKEKYNNLYFFIVGDSFNEEQDKIKSNIKKLIAKYELNDNVILTGYRRDVSTVMNSFDIFVLTSDNEPFGRVLIEALSLNLPIVSTNNGGAPEIVKENINGILVNYNDKVALAKGIETILDDLNLRKSMENNNRISAKERFSIQSHVLSIQNLYNELIK